MDVVVPVAVRPLVSVTVAEIETVPVAESVGDVTVHVAVVPELDTEALYAVPPIVTIQELIVAP